MSETLSVRNAHRPDSHVVLTARKGDRLRFERRDTGFDGWIWCMNDRGVGAWAPEAWVDVSGTTCEFTRDYISRELDVRVGDEVELIEEESGWGWVMNASGELGWVPLECLMR